MAAQQDFSHYINYKIVLFDAQCLLCQGWAQFLIRYDLHAQFKLTSVQSPLGQKLLQYYGFSTHHFDTMLLIDHGQIFTESTAFLKIMQQLQFPLKLCQIGLFMPVRLRDPLYRLVAKNRYRWFGKTDDCLLPHPKLKQHFLEYYLHV